MIIGAEDLGELYSTRLLVFLETSPQSNKYHQVYLTAKEFKKVSDMIGKDTGDKDVKGLEIVEIQMSKEIYDLPDLKEINENV